MIPIPKQTAPPAIKRISVKKWTNGTVTAFDDGRTPVDGLRGSGNVLLDQDGTVRPRPSLSLYGTALPGTALGEIFELVQTVGTVRTYWMIGMFNVSGTTRPYVSKDGGAWSATAGKTYDNSAATHYLQADNKVVIMNGTDNLSYFDVTTIGGANTIVPFTALSTPGAPSIANNGTTDITAGTAPFTITYRISANSTVGETIASSSTSQAVNKDRDFWDPAINSLKVTWSAVTNAVSYNVYMGTVAGYEYLIASAVNGVSYTDDGSAAQDVTTLFPTTDSTPGPKTTRGSVINGQIFMVGDTANPFYVRFGGTDSASILDFSPAHGGWSEVGRGTKEIPVHVKPFRDNKGSPQITVLCQGTNGHGKRYLLVPDSLTSGSDTITFFDVIEDNGQDGTDSPDGIILQNDSLWYPSRDGFKTTGTKPQIQNLLSTNRVSNTIQTDIKDLNNASMSKCVGVGFEGRLYWAVPNGSTSNNEIWVLDLDRDGAWMKPWNIPADWLTLYNDNSGVTHFIVLSNNTLYELSYSHITNDNGIAFQTSGNSGQITFSPDGREWAHILQVIFTLLRPQGAIDFSIAGKTEDSSLAAVGAESFTYASTVAGWSEPANGSGIVGWGKHAWSQLGIVPVSFADASVDVIVEVDEDVQWWQYGWNSTTTGVDYNLSDVVVEYCELGIRDLA